MKKVPREESKLALFKDIYLWYAKGDEWLDSVPTEVQTAFFDNPHNDSKTKIIDRLLEFVFNEDELFAVTWFMYEWHASRELTIFFEGNEYAFNNIDEYVNFLQVYEGWE